MSFARPHIESIDASRTAFEIDDAALSTFREQGFLRLESVFEPDEVAVLSDELDRLIDEWAHESMGWSGDWREEYLDPDQREATSLIAMHDLQQYSEPYLRMVSDPRLVTPVAQIVGGDAELHHSTLHAKPPDEGTPFPMHQDWAFYKHHGSPLQYVDALVHVDDVPPERGPLRFVEGSHQQGALEHIEGEGQTPHLPTDEYPLEEATEVPAEAGDVILMSYHTIHGSRQNRAESMRRLVRVGYRDPANEQFEGQALDRDGVIVAGRERAGVDGGEN
jgi:ectoine hydroxylase-related dioxygenase (phytanoyl-CoA dioxygenase family)